MVDGYCMLHVVGVTRHLEDKNRPWTTTVPLPSNIGRRTTNNSMCPSKTYLAHRLLPDTDDGNDYTSTRPLLQSTQTPFPRAVSLVIHEGLKGSVFGLSHANRSRLFPASTPAVFQLFPCSFPWSYRP
jgi:hypothetical protein